MDANDVIHKKMGFGRENIKQLFFVNYQFMLSQSVTSINGILLPLVIFEHGMGKDVIENFGLVNALLNCLGSLVFTFVSKKVPRFTLLLSTGTILLLLNIGTIFSQSFTVFSSFRLAQ